MSIYESYRTLDRNRLLMKVLVTSICSIRNTALSCSLILPLLSKAQSQANVPDSVQGTFQSLGYHKLFVKESGPNSAKYTVIFESGGGGSSSDWKKVQSLLPQTIKTIVYDRAGLGRSEKGPLPRTMSQEVFELHKLIESKVNGPVILVGQSIGGLLVRMYTQKYGSNVAGLVLIDPTDESAMLGSMRYGGWVRLREKATGKPIPSPQLKKKESVGYDSTADYLAEEFQLLYLSRKTNPRQLGDRPVIILGAGKRNQPPGTPDEQWKSIRLERDQQIRDLQTLSSNSKVIVDSASGHAIHYDNPKIVANSIETIIQTAEKKTALGK